MLAQNLCIELKSTLSKSYLLLAVWQERWAHKLITNQIFGKRSPKKCRHKNEINYKVAYILPFPNLALAGASCTGSPFFYDQIVI